MWESHQPRAGVGVCSLTASGERPLLETEKGGGRDSLSFLLSVINYPAALNKNQLLEGKPDRVSFHLMCAEPSLLSHLPDVEHMPGSE